MDHQAEHEPAYRRWTPAIERGIRYAAAQRRFDAQHTTVAIDGEPITTAISNEDLAAAEAWLRDQLRRRGVD